MTQFSAAPTSLPVPVACVGGVVLGEAGGAASVLLIRRARPPREGEWSLPGGRIEPGETARAALAREIREETGIEAGIGALLDVVDYIERDAGGGLTHHYVLIDYLARPRGGVLRAGDDAREARWWPLDALAGLGLWPVTRTLIERAAGRHHASS